MTSSNTPCSHAARPGLPGFFSVFEPGRRGRCLGQMEHAGGMFPVVWGPTPAGQEKEEGQPKPRRGGRQGSGRRRPQRAKQPTRRRTQVIELDGYFRTRAELLHNFNLGQATWHTAARWLSAFPHAARCSTSLAGARRRTLGDHHMRLRLSHHQHFGPSSRGGSDRRLRQPHLRLHARLADSRRRNRLCAPTWRRRESCRLPDTPARTLHSAIVPSGVGRGGQPDRSLRFGRMPWHFGRGMYFNKGDCADCDGGTTVDRIMAITRYTAQLALSWISAFGLRLGHRLMQAAPIQRAPWICRRRRGGADHRGPDKKGR